MGLGILLIAITTAVSTSILGVFLVIRKMSMVTDAISHTVLLGIVLSFLIVPNLDSPFLILGAVLMGLVTVFLTESLVKTKKIKEDAATGVIFPFLFSVAILIISLFISDVHMDTDAVLLGKLEFSSIEQLVIFNRNIGPKNLYISIFVLILNSLFIKIFFKELKIVSFDESLSLILGFSPLLIHYLLMTLVSLTAVTAFSQVGSILVVALMIGPPITALQFTKDLKQTILLSAVIAVINSTIGYFVALALNVTISGVIATTTLVVFLLTTFFNPFNGIIAKIIKRKIQKHEFDFIIFLTHIINHSNTISEQSELSVEKIHYELNWTLNKTKYFINEALNNNYIKYENKLLKITKTGINYQNSKMIEYSR